MKLLLFALFLLDVVSDQCESQKICDKVFSKDSFIIKYYPDKCKTQKYVIELLMLALKWVPDWLFMKKHY